MSGWTEPTLRLAFTARALVAPPQEFGETAAGRRRVVPILGGTVSGERFSGEILPGGADWQVLRGDLTTELVARYTIRATDGTLVSVVNRGLRHGPPEAMRATRDASGWNTAEPRPISAAATRMTG